LRSDSHLSIRAHGAWLGIDNGEIECGGIKHRKEALRQRHLFVVNDQFIGEPLSPRRQVSFDFCVECLPDILRVQNIPPAKRDTEGNAARETPQGDRREECEDDAMCLPSVMDSVSADFERVAFDMGWTGCACANLNDASREELIIGERVNPRNNIRAEISRLLNVATHSNI